MPETSWARRAVGPVLALAILAISSAGVMARLLHDVHPVAIGFWRTVAIALLLAPALRRVALRDLGLTLLAGAALAGHFWTWFESLQHTSVMRSTVLVCTTPIWVGALEALVFKHRPSLRYWGGIAVAIAGVGVMVLQPGAAGAAMGDGLAISGGVLAALYLLVGRSVRQRVGFAAYGSMVCGAAALWLLPVALGLGAPLEGFRPEAWAGLAAMALGPQLMGHVGLNYAVRYVPASVVSALIPLEPVGATLLAALILGETPGAQEVAGAVVVVVGVLLAARG